MNDAMRFNFLAPQLSSKKTLKSGGNIDFSGQDSGGKEAASNLFVVKLNQMLAKNGINQKGTSSIDSTKTSASSKVDILSESVKSDLLKEMNTAQGVEILTKLKNYLMASGHNDLKGVSIGDDGLDAIKSLLAKAGFPGSKVEALVKTLKSESDDGKVSVSALMDGFLSLTAEELSVADSSTDTDAFSIDKKSDKTDNDAENNDLGGYQLLDISVIPFISSIMKSLGVPDDVINSIIADSEVKGEGLNLNTLIGDLQALQKTSFFTGISFENTSDVESIKAMLSQLGLSSKSSKLQNIEVQASSVKETNSTGNGSVTLGNFVSALEALRQKSSMSNTQEYAVKDGLNQGIADLPDEMSIIGLQQSSKNSFALISSSDHKPESSDSKIIPFSDNKFSGKNQLNNNDVESDLLIKKLMGDLKVNNGSSNKVTEENQPAEMEIRYRTLKSANHQLLMNLSETQDTESAQNTPLNSDANAMSVKEKDINEVLVSLGINVKTKSDTTTDRNTSADSPIVDTTTAGTDNISVTDKDIKNVIASLGINVKTKFDTTTTTDRNTSVDSPVVDTTTAGTDNISVTDKDIKNVFTSLGVSGKNKLVSDKSGNTVNQDNQIDSITKNLFQAQQQNIKNTSDTLGTASAAVETGNGKVISDLVHTMNNVEILDTGKKTGPQRRSIHNENEVDSILTRIDKKHTIDMFNSNRSDSSFSGQSDTKGSSLGGTRDKSVSSILPSYVTNQVVRSINRAFSNGESEIRLQLRPAELGRIFMTIETQGDTLKVSIVTENQAAKDMLTGHANDLKASLATNGINIGSFDVDMGSDFKQSMADSRQQPQSGSGSGNNRGSSGLNTSSSTVESDIAASSDFLKNEDNMIHFVA